MRRSLASIIIRKWDPRRLGSALALWIDPSDVSTMAQSNAGTTMATDTSVCGYAGDKSGNGYNLISAADDTTRPSWNSSSGHPYLNFDGSNDLLKNSTAPLGMYTAGSCSIFMAFRGPSSASKFIFGERGAGGNPIYQMWTPSTGTTMEFLIRNDAATFVVSGVAQAPNMLDDTDSVYGQTDDGANFLLYDNGAQVDSGAYTRSGTLTLTNTSLGGSFVGGTAAEWKAFRLYGLVVVKRVITSGERGSLVTYLGAKAGLVL